MRYSPPAFGWAAAALVPSARRAIVRNLRRIRGPASSARDAREVLATFSNYASCLAEVLSNDAPGGPRYPETSIRNEQYVHDASARGRGIVMVTAHTAGWEMVGPAVARDQGLKMMIVMQAEPDAAAQALHDDARRRAGVLIAHAGDDPLSALPMLWHLRSPGGVVALQLDPVLGRFRCEDNPVDRPTSAVAVSMPFAVLVLRAEWHQDFFDRVGTSIERAQHIRCLPSLEPLVREGAPQ